jgi:hypothetical protein
MLETVSSMSWPDLNNDSSRRPAPATEYSETPIPVPETMAAVPSTSTSDEPVSAARPKEQEEEPPLDVEVLKEIARKALIDALNSVQFYHKPVFREC